MDNMLNFRMCGHLVFGVGAIRELPDRVHALGGGRPLLVTDRGLVKAGVCDQVRAILDEAGIRYDVFDAVEADPSIEVALACADLARRANVGLLIGLGGGSSLDIAKVTAVLLRHDGDIADLFGVNQVKQAGVPTIMIPTTAGTGSEVTPIAVLSDNAEWLAETFGVDLPADVSVPSLTDDQAGDIVAFLDENNINNASNLDDIAAQVQAGEIEVPDSLIALAQSLGIDVDALYDSPGDDT